MYDLNQRYLFLDTDFRRSTQILKSACIHVYLRPFKIDHKMLIPSLNVHLRRGERAPAVGIVETRIVMKRDFISRHRQRAGPAKIEPSL